MLLLPELESARQAHLLDLSVAVAMQRPRRRSWDWEDEQLLRLFLMRLDSPTGFELLGSGHVLDSPPGIDSHEVMATVRVCTHLSAVVVRLCSR